MRFILLVAFALGWNCAAANCPDLIVCENGNCVGRPLPQCSAGSTRLTPIPEVRMHVPGSALLSTPPATQPILQPVPVPASPVVIPPKANSPPAFPLCAENGSCYGDISAVTGNPKTTQVQGYYRKDGTYVRGHFRSSRR